MKKYLHKKVTHNKFNKFDLNYSYEKDRDCLICGDPTGNIITLQDINSEKRKIHLYCFLQFRRMDTCRAAMKDDNRADILTVVNNFLVNNGYLKPIV